MSAASHEESPRTPVEVTRDTRAPMYRQLSRALESEIRSGVRPLNIPLPSTRALALELGLSRNTVSAAYAELLAQGLIEGQPRRGYFINAEMARSVPHGGALPQADAATDAAQLGARDQSWRRLLRACPSAETPEIIKQPDWERQPFPFVVGQVDEREFPRLVWARALRDALEPPHLFHSVRDAVDGDDPELVRAILRHVLPARGVRADPENVLLTIGSQQGLDLLAHTLAGPGTTVGLEDPGYVDARQTFLRAGATIRPFPVDEDGIVLPERLSGLDVLYVTPSHQSPTNVTLSRERRLRLLEQSRAEGTVIIEDDYDSEFRYEGQPIPALRAHEGAEHVIYLGSFTKFLAPGLRLGYVVADPDLIRELRRARRYRLRHLPGHSQRAMALLINSGQYRRTITRRRNSLGVKWEMLRTALREELPWRFPVPPGGVSVWVTGPSSFDGVELAERALRHGIVVERGDVFFAEPERHRHHIRLGFAAIDLSRISTGVQRLAQLLP